MSCRVEELVDATFKNKKKSYREKFKTEMSHAITRLELECLAMAVYKVDDMLEPFLGRFDTFLTTYLDARRTFKTKLKAHNDELKAIKDLERAILSTVMGFGLGWVSKYANSDITEGMDKEFVKKAFIDQMIGDVTTQVGKGLDTLVESAVKVPEPKTGQKDPIQVLKSMLDQKDTLIKDVKKVIEDAKDDPWTAMGAPIHGPLHFTPTDKCRNEWLMAIVLQNDVNPNAIRRAIERRVKQWGAALNGEFFQSVENAGETTSWRWRIEKSMWAAWINANFTLQTGPSKGSPKLSRIRGNDMMYVGVPGYETKPWEGQWVKGPWVHRTSGLQKNHLEPHLIKLGLMKRVGNRQFNTDKDWQGDERINQRVDMLQNANRWLGSRLARIDLIPKPKTAGEKKNAARNELRRQGAAVTNKKLAKSARTAARSVR